VIVVVACLAFWLGLIAGMFLGAAVVSNSTQRFLAARDRRLAEWAAVDRGRRIARVVLDQDGAG
jgi:hypothetical protein